MKRLLAVVAVAVWTSGGALTACSSSTSSTGASTDAGGLHDGTTSAESGGGNDGARPDAASFPDAGGGADGAAGNDGGQGVDSSGDDAAETSADSGGNADGGSSAEGGAGDAGDAASSEGGLIDCGGSPTLHEDEAGVIYCGFDGTADLTCGVGQECCLGGAQGGGVFAPQECATTGAVCPNAAVPDAGAPAIPIECTQIADCTANGATSAVACCLQGATPPAVPAGCSYPKATEGTAVVCESSDAGATGPRPCAQGEVQICGTQADCPTGTTCTPGKWKIFQVGFCM
ncbi:MAG TPA: hypothetical protein VGG39_15190 [Polyangiaceae bacterium]|jgi:hypothetical protein